jgi:site-specific DNA-methyltransferase (adenine-specific)
MANLVLNSSNENDLVLDCFMGSGNTGVACMNTNRKFMGIELDKNYFEIAKNRIEESLNKEVI